MVVDMDLLKETPTTRRARPTTRSTILVREANGGSEFYVPGRGEALTAALTRAAREFESDSF